ncbi:MULTISPECIES: MarR family winged helix-turn-helix transcriptional regulator [Psychrilyobacter]|uniref:MarR family transcriptional regulator n=1 Tax=Psychrilyobacter piezotolerans TaxID=2293438 RepID=A0ABX9KI10_9FUSO|nr:MULTISPECIES: MarR family transcriptional regulator [Psychrilyobacter]MCS5421372.1 MarR family transcriptional regulator [Psychrilyobacter sp. S5]NDI77481.1 MarR family transcriptional regulator [Psychrilyobacter piezotolerans]RDE63003.1 MarR family transcriptional regulator [Psychrilyobacter sp. S5]REI41761.1 MarR family transcriptional regulator [Psychrilyobacter piezotolerans]
MIKLSDCVGFITNKASKKIADVFNEKLSAHEITRVQWTALYFLGKWEYINQSELAEKMDIKKSTIVRLVDRMEKEGYVRRKKDIKDRRITYICLTELGKKLRKELLPFGEEFSKLITRDISHEEIEIFKKVLNKLVENAQLSE